MLYQRKAVDWSTPLETTLGATAALLVAFALWQVYRSTWPHSVAAATVCIVEFAGAMSCRTKLVTRLLRACVALSVAVCFVRTPVAVLALLALLLLSWLRAGPARRWVSLVVGMSPLVLIPIGAAANAIRWFNSGERCYVTQGCGLCASDDFGRGGPAVPTRYVRTIGGCDRVEPLLITAPHNATMKVLVRVLGRDDAVHGEAEDCDTREHAVRAGFLNPICWTERENPFVHDLCAE